MKQLAVFVILLANTIISVNVTGIQLYTWSEWSKCSVSCGKGFRIRSQICLKRSQCSSGMHDVGRCENEAGSCLRVQDSVNRKPDPTLRQTSFIEKGTEWTPWSNWTECSVSCGNGVQYKIRECPTGSTCPGDPVSLKVCVAQTQKCTRILSSANEKKRVRLVNTKKNTLYKQLGFATLFLIGFVCLMLFMVILMQLRKRSPRISERLKARVSLNQQPAAIIEIPRKTQTITDI